MGEALLGMSYTESYTLPADITTASHAICIGVLDYYGNEYAMRILGEEETEAVSTTLSSPGENEGIESWKGLVFKWEAVKKADSYIIQIASDAEFENILAVQELTANSFEADRRLNLAFKGNGTYFWRVKTRRPNTGDIWSETRRFVIGQTDGIENTEFSEKTASDKPYVIIRDGQLLIVKGGGYYSLTGVRIE